MEWISTQELGNSLDDPRLKIIDVRSVEAYNGWRKRNEARGGHIKGARSLPSKWLKYMDWIEIVRSKNIEPEDKLLLYGYDESETEKAARQLARAGYQNLLIYPHFVNEWASANHPMEKLARHRQLVSAHWVQQLISTGQAAEYDNDKFVICHAHYQNRDDYEKGHIPGAVTVDTNALESTETWNRRSPEELRTVLEDLGITHDTTVILYGRFSFPENEDPFPGSSAGHLGAMRCAFIMLYAGVQDVRILNGGLQSWEDEGFEVTTEETEIQPVKEFGTGIPARPELAVDLDEAQDMLKAADKNLVCVRSWREYIGEVSGYHYIEKKGRIPGAVFADCGSDAYHMENYRNLDHTMREYHEVEAKWKALGITPDKHNAFYCGTGWRGSEAFLNGWLMGWPRVSLFDGGWYEWSNNNLPFETGEPQEIQQHV
jgi:thiosulfate/3-mercaptopyruvate sulfurtransferase